MKHLVMPRDPPSHPPHRMHSSACFCRYLLTCISGDPDGIAITTPATISSTVGDTLDLTAS